MPKRKGRAVGGAARMASLSPEERKEFARIGANARWHGKGRKQMAWRVGTKVPINVYDGDGKPVCQCQTPQHAAMIVRCVNEVIGGPPPEPFWLVCVCGAEMEQIGREWAKGSRLFQCPKCLKVNLG